MKLFIQHNGEQSGPFTLAEVQARLREKSFSPNTDFARHEGVDVWQPLGRVLFDIHTASTGNQQTASESPQMLKPEGETVTASSPESDPTVLSREQNLALPSLPRRRFGGKGNIHIFTEGKWMNPVPLPEVQSLLSDGLLANEDYFFIHGMESPRPIDEWSAFAPMAGCVVRPLRKRVFFVTAGALALIAVACGAWLYSGRNFRRAAVTANDDKTTFDPSKPFELVPASRSRSEPPRFDDPNLEDVTAQYRKPPAPALSVREDLSPKPVAFDLVAIAKKTRSAVVLIEVLDASGKSIATGSGFFVSPDGMLVTNFHVIEKAHTVIAKAESGAMYRVLGAISANDKSDIALLQADAKGAPFLPLGDSEKADVGERVAVIGSPLGLEGSLSEGVISAKRQLADGEQWMQITAAISPGSSGSPVMNANGDVIGVATMLIRNSQALNFAVPSEAVTENLNQADQRAPLISFQTIRNRASSSALAKQASDEAKRVAAEAQSELEAAATREADFYRAFHSPEFDAVRKATQTAIGMGDWTKVLRAAQTLVALYPQFGSGYESLGEAYHNMGFAEEAITAYQSAIKLLPTGGAWKALGSLFKAQGKNSQATSAFSQAVTEYQQELKLAPTPEIRAITFENLGECYLGIGNRAEARNAYLAVTRGPSGPGSFLAWGVLGEMYADDGDEGNAIVAFRNAHKKGLESDAWVALASFYERKGLSEHTARAKDTAWKLHLNGR